MITQDGIYDICDKCIDTCVKLIYDEGGSLPAVNQKLGRKNVDLVATLGIKPRFKKVNFQRVENQCFYLCPLSEPFNTIYRDHVVPTIQNLGLTVKRADEVFGTEPIIEDIWEGICESEIILADVTGRNPNVMYEPLCYKSEVARQAVKRLPSFLKQKWCLRTTIKERRVAIWRFIRYRILW
jgi:hypothetical protein